MFTLSRLSHAPRVVSTPAMPQMRVSEAKGPWIRAAATPRRKSRPTILSSFAIAAALLASAGCSKGIDIGNDDATGHLNRHPVKRYEIIATSHAPGPWDSFEGAYIGYDVVNTKCVPMIPFLGTQHVPNTGLNVPMVQVDDHTWKGYFYRDALRDENYFKLRMCHWDVTSVSASAMFQSVRFAWSGSFEELLRDGTQTSYFKKSAYGDRSFAPYGAPDYSHLRPEYKREPGDFFPVTISIKESVLPSLFSKPR